MAQQGKVKWFNKRRGYGFITADAGEDVFVHYRDIEGNGFRKLDEGEVVSFEVQDGIHGHHAINVAHVDNEAIAA